MNELYKRLYNLDISDLERLKEIANDIITNKFLNQIIREEEVSKYDYEDK